MNLLDAKLWGIKIWDSTGIYYYTEVDVKQSITHTVPTGQQDGYNSIYPFVTYNGIPFYYHGTASGNFSDNKSGECYEDYNFDWRVDKNGNVIYNVVYINGFIKWLHNKKIKQLQLDENLVIPVRILQDIQWDTEKAISDGWSCSISFDWVQQGDEYSLHDKQYVSFCPECSAMLAPSAVFCQKCGTRVGG